MYNYSAPHKKVWFEGRNACVSSKNHAFLWGGQGAKRLWPPAWASRFKRLRMGVL